MAQPPDAVEHWVAMVGAVLPVPTVAVGPLAIASTIVEGLFASQAVLAAAQLAEFDVVVRKVIPKPKSRGSRRNE